MKVIAFQKGEAPLIYSDALVLSDQEAEQLSEQDIERMEEERYQQWLAIITAPPSEEVTQDPPEEAVDG